MTHILRCRARAVVGCLDGQPTTAQFMGEDLPMSEDGTYDGETVICDFCYIFLLPLTPHGRGMLREMDKILRERRDKDNAPDYRE